MGKEKHRMCPVADYYNLERGCSLFHPKQVNHTAIQLLDMRCRVLVCWIVDAAPARQHWPSAKAAPAHLIEEGECGRMYACTRLAAVQKRGGHRSVEALSTLRELMLSPTTTGTRMMRID